MQQRAGWSAETHSCRQAAHDLAKLRGKRLVQRRSRSRRYEAEPGGVQTMCPCLLLSEQGIKPLLACIVSRMGLPPKNSSALDQHYIALREELHRTFETLGLAA